MFVGRIIEQDCSRSSILDNKTAVALCIQAHAPEINRVGNDRDARFDAIALEQNEHRIYGIGPYPEQRAIGARSGGNELKGNWKGAQWRNDRGLAQATD